jgi:hypothetical protein
MLVADPTTPGLLLDELGLICNIRFLIYMYIAFNKPILPLIVFTDIGFILTLRK